MKSLLIKALTFFFGTGVGAITSFIVFATLLRSTGKSDYGTFVYSQSVVLWLAVVVQYGLSISGAALIAREPERVPALAISMVSLRVVLACGAALVLLVLGVLSTGLQRELFFAYIPFLFATAFQLDFLAIGQGRARTLAGSQVAMNIVYFALAMTVMFLHGPIWCIPLALALGFSCAAIVQFRTLLPKDALSYGFAAVTTDWRRMLVLAWPITAAQFVQLGYYSVDIVLLEVSREVGRPGLGEYGAISRLMQTGVLPLVALVNVLGPQLSAAWSRGDIAEVRVLNRLFVRISVLVGLLGGVFFAVVAPGLLEYISGKQMPISRTVSWVFGLTYMVIGLHSPFSVSLAFLASQRQYLMANTSAFVVALIACLVLVPRMGYLGGALGILAGVVALFIFSVLAFSLLIRRAEAATGA